jgi:hypothetical protein
LHLLLQGADRGIEGGQLSFHTVAPEAQQAQVTLLVPAHGLLVIAV